MKKTFDAEDINTGVDRAVNFWQNLEEEEKDYVKAFQALAMLLYIV